MNDSVNVVLNGITYTLPLNTGIDNTATVKNEIKEITFSRDTYKAHLERIFRIVDSMRCSLRMEFARDNKIEYKSEDYDTPKVDETVWMLKYLNNLLNQLDSTIK